jgi:hypothetical protein
MPRINPIAPNGSWGGDGGKMKDGKKAKEKKWLKWGRMAWRGNGVWPKMEEARKNWSK